MLRIPKNIFLLLMFCSPCWLAASEGGHPRLITVNGEADVQADPDRAVISFTVETDDKNLETAKKENDDRSHKLINAIKSFRIDPKDLRTDQLQVEPRYQGYPKKDFQGYFVRNSMTLTVRDLAKFEAIYDSLLMSGAEYVNGLRFETSKLSEHKTRAREAALKNAQDKAHDMAKTLGQSIGKPISIQENGGPIVPMYKGMAAMAAMRSGEAAEGPAIATGQLTIHADVTVAFELKD